MEEKSPFWLSIRKREEVGAEFGIFFASKKFERGLHQQEGCCAQDNNLSEESTNQAETDAAEDVPNTTRIENNREKQLTRYLTRFDNLPTSSGQGGERDFIDSTINTN